MNLRDLDVRPGTFRDLVEIIAAEFTRDDLVQFCMLAFSALAIGLVASDGELNRWGYVAGLASQPFWLYATLHARTASGGRMWGMIALSVYYCGAWAYGIAARF